MNYSKYLKIAGIHFLLISFLSISGFAFPSVQGWDEGVAAFKSKNYRLATKHFQAYVASNPNSDEAHYMLGLSLEQLKHSQQSMRHFKKAYDLNPNDLSIKVALGRAYVKQGQFKSAYTVLKDTDRLYKVQGISAELGAGLIYDVGVEALYTYGTAALKIGKKKEGLEALRKAAEAEPNNRRYQRAYKTAQQ